MLKKPSAVRELQKGRKIIDRRWHGVFLTDPHR